MLHLRAFSISAGALSCTLAKGTISGASGQTGQGRGRDVKSWVLSLAFRARVAASLSAAMHVRLSSCITRS